MISYLKESDLLHDQTIFLNLKPQEILLIIRQLSRERKFLMYNLLASVIDVVIGLKYAKLLEVTIKTHMSDLIFGLVGMATSGLRLYGQYEQNKESQKELKEL
jgi:hypothetical protein